MSGRDKWLDEYYGDSKEDALDAVLEEWDEMLKSIQNGVTIPAPGLSEYEGDDSDPWEY